MAKKIQIDIEVNGKMQKATVSTKKLHKALEGVDTAQDKVSKSARTVDRNLKGVSQQSANGAKNFSKMSQGIGGTLVPAYATLAANLFAVSAAFEFLKRASQVSRLEKAQQSFATNTGKALGFMTEKLIDASNGMLSFQEAAQAAAIGTAKGFSGDQLESLAVGAQKAAQALGRDFGDAFDRLIRGVSKAEPELLDELGITLRLENATKRYADALGLQADKLTDAQRSQAVLLETQRQLDEQYSNQEIIADPFIKLQKTFTDIVKTITEKVLPIFSAFADILNRNATLAIAAFAAFAISIVRAIVPFDKFSDKIDEWKEGHQAAVDSAKDDLKEYKKALARTNATAEKMRQRGARVAQAGAKRAMAAGATSPILTRLSEGGVGALKGPDKANLEKALRSAELQYERSGKITRGIFAEVGIDIARQIGKGLKAASAESRRTEGKFKRFFTTISLQAKIAGANINKFISGGLLKLEGPLKKIGKGVKLLGRGIFAAFSVQTIIEIFQEWVLAFDSMINFFAKGLDWLGSKIGLSFGLEEAYQGSKLQKRIQGYAKDIRDARNQSEIIKDVTNDIDAFRRSVEAIGKGAEGFDAVKRLNALATLNLGETVSKIEQITDKGKRAQAIADVKKEWSALSAALGNPKLAAILENNNLSFAEQAAQIKALGLAAGGTAADNQAFTDRLTQQNEILNEGSIENMVAYIREMQTASNAIKETSSATGELIDRQKDVDGLFGGSQKILDVYAELRRQTEGLRDAEQEVAMARERIKTLDPLTRERANIALKIADQENKLAKAVRDQLDTQTVLENLQRDGSQADEKALQNAIDRNAEAENAVALETLRLEVVNELADRELKINDLKKEKQGLDLEQRRLQLIQQLVSLEEKKMGYVKEQAAAMENVLNARFERALLSSRSAGGFVDPRKEQQARIKLEEHLVKIRTAQINREFKMKKTQIAMEEKQLLLRNKIAKLEYKQTMLDLQQDPVDLATYDAIEASIEETARLGRETAVITKNAALETVDLTLDKMKQAFDDLSLQGQMANAFESGFRDGLNNALSGLISGDMSFKQALKSFADTLLNAMVAKLQSILVDAIMDGIFGPEEDPAEKMERVLKEEKLSKNVGTAIEEKGKDLVTGIENALSSTVENQVKVQCCDLNTPEPVVVNNSKEIARDIAEATQLTDAQQLVKMIGGAVVDMMGSEKGGDDDGKGKVAKFILKILAAPFALIIKGFQKLFGTMGSHLYDARTGKYIGKVDNNDPNQVRDAADGYQSGNVTSAEGRAGGLLEKLKYIITYPFMIIKKFMRGEIDRDMTRGIHGPPGPGTDMRQDETGIFGNIFTYVQKFFGKIGDGASNLFGWFKGLFGDKKDTDGMNLMAFAKDILGSSENGGTGIIGMFMKFMPMLQKIFGMFGGGGGAGGAGGGGGGFMDLLGAVGSFFGLGARYGGIMEPPKGYRAGGIANGSSAGYPAILHGKEAVVPLPHGNKIPVEIKGSSGQQNNIGITVNISSDGNTDTSEESARRDGKDLARAISAAVQDELIKQRRAGGMLSPYGA